MSDPTRRRANWEVKFDTEQVKRTLDRKRDDMAAHYQEATASLWAMEVKVREVLNINGVHTTQYVPYYNYARQLYKLTREQGISGESFALAAKVLLDKWAARDLDPAVLAQIRTGVFDIGEPKPR